MAALSDGPVVVLSETCRVCRWHQPSDKLLPGRCTHVDALAAGGGCSWVIEGSTPQWCPARADDSGMPTLAKLVVVGVGVAALLQLGGCLYLWWALRQFG
jgi:hypothetical protein